MNTAKLKGFNYPLTPKGKSTLNPSPPWYYSSDFLDVEFWAQPAVVASLLPNGLEPDPAANGHCNALFYDWQFSGANEEYLDPARYLDSRLSEASRPSISDQVLRRNKQGRSGSRTRIEVRRQPNLSRATHC